MLATTAIGAIWACCSPDFGERGTLDRLAQLRPKVLVCVDGYRYGGKAFDRRTAFFVLLAVMALLLALGTPLNALLYYGIPGFAQSGSPSE